MKRFVLRHAPCGMLRLVLVASFLSLGPALVAQVYIPPVVEPANDQYSYVPNQGQLLSTDGTPASSVLYYTRGIVPNVYLQADRISYVTEKLNDPQDRSNVTVHRIDMEFVCLNETGCSPTVQAMEPVGHYYNWFLPHTGPSGVVNITPQKRIVYENAFPDIDVHYYSNPSAPRMTVVVHPGANPQTVHFRFSGQDSLLQTANNDIQAFLNQDVLTFEQFVAYQVTAGGSVVPLSWQPSYLQLGNGEVRLHNIGSYNTSLPLIFDLGAPPAPPVPPTNNDWGSFVGTNFSIDQMNSVCDDDLNNVYTTGMVEDGSGFPVTPGVVSVVNDGPWDAFIIKWNVFNEIVWASYLGGGGIDEGKSIVVDNEFNVYLLIETASSDMIPECALGNYCQSMAIDPNDPQHDLFIAKLDPQGSQILWSTYYGGIGQESSNFHNLVLDDNDDLYFSGFTLSGAFPTLASATPGSYFKGSQQPGASDGFIVKLNSNGVRQWATLLGSDNADEIQGIALKSNGRVIVHGNTSATLGGDIGCGIPTNGGFPLCDNAGTADYFQSTPGDLFITELSDDAVLLWSTFFGPGGSAQASAVAVTDQDEVYIVGEVRTDGSVDQCQVPSDNGFPVCASAGPNTLFSDTHQGAGDIYLARFDANRVFSYGTLHGGTLEDEANGLTIGPNSTVYLAGTTSSNDWPTRFKFGFFFQGTYNDVVGAALAADPFIMAVDATNTLRWSTYYGGTFTPNGTVLPTQTSERGHGIIATSSDQLYFVGATNSAGFPINCSPFATHYCRDSPANVPSLLDEAFIVRFDASTILSTGESPAPLKELHLYPNPAEDLLSVEVDAAQPGQSFLSVFDISGRQVLVQSLRISQGLNTAVIDVSGLTSGLYILDLQQGTQHIRNRFIRSR